MTADKDYGRKFGAIALGTETYPAPDGYYIYAIVPQPTADIKAIPVDTSEPYYTSNRAVDGDAKTITSQITGQYSSVVVSSGSCDVYIDVKTSDI